MEVGCNAGDWIDLAQDRIQWRAYVTTVMNLRVPQTRLVGELFCFLYCNPKQVHYTYWYTYFKNTLGFPITPDQDTRGVC